MAFPEQDIESEFYILEETLGDGSVRYKIMRTFGVVGYDVEMTIRSSLEDARKARDQLAKFSVVSSRVVE